MSIRKTIRLIIVNANQKVAWPNRLYDTFQTILSRWQMFSWNSIWTVIYAIGLHCCLTWNLNGSFFFKLKMSERWMNKSVLGQSMGLVIHVNANRTNWKIKPILAIVVYNVVFTEKTVMQNFTLNFLSKLVVCVNFSFVLCDLFLI